MRQGFAPIVLVYGAALVSGLATILFPASGNIFTAPAQHDLSGGAFGLLWIPQIVVTMVCAFFSARLAKRFSMRWVLRMGLMAHIASMACYVGSHFLLDSAPLDYVALLGGTSFMGAGFGFTMAAVSPFAYALFPDSTTASVVGVHMAAGLGTMAAPFLLTRFQINDLWWMSGAVVAGLVLIWLVLSFFIRPELPDEQQPKDPTERSLGEVPLRIWLILLMVFFYGAVEGSFGNFITIFLKEAADLDVIAATLGLSVYWLGVTLGRLVFGLASLRFGMQWFYLGCLGIVAALMYFLPEFSEKIPLYLTFGAAGFALAPFFPNTVNRATEENEEFSAFISGATIAALQLGIGLSSNLIGWLQEPLGLATVFRWSGLYAAAALVMAWFLFGRAKKEGAS